MSGIMVAALTRVHRLKDENSRVRMRNVCRDSSAIRSSPQVRFAPDDLRDKPLKVARQTRPRGFDSHRQNKRKPCRCHRTRVSGFTTVRRVRRSITCDKTTNVIRVAGSGRRGFTCRSAYNASWFLRNRFSAMSGTCDRQLAETSCSRSPARQNPVRNDHWAMVARCLRFSASTRAR